MTARIINHHGEEDRCHYCDVPFVNGQCPECKSIKLVELWRRSRGFTLTGQWEWQKPSPDYEPDDQDFGAIEFLICEWDYGGLAASAGEAGTATTVEQGVVHEHATASDASGDAQETATDWLLRAGPIAKKMNLNAEKDR